MTHCNYAIIDRQTPIKLPTIDRVLLEEQKVDKVTSLNGQGNAGVFVE